MAHALDLVGERWTLLIVRDLVFGPLRFSDLRNGLPGLAPNLLSDRLRFLVDQGIAERLEESEPRRVVYSLTPRGRQLSPVVHELARFGVDNWTDPDVDPPPPRLRRGALLALMSPERLGSLRWTALFDLPESPITLMVDHSGSGTPLERVRLIAGEGGPYDLVIATTLGTLTRLRRGELDRATVERERLHILGDEGPRRELALLMGWPPGD